MLEEFDDFIHDAGWDWQAPVHPGYMLNHQNFDWHEVVIVEASVLLVSPCKHMLIRFEDVLC